MQSRSVFGIDIFIIGASVALTVIGVLFIYSSGITSNGRLFTNEYIRQVLWGATGLAVLFVVAFVGHTTLKSWAVPFYVAMIVLLLFTLAFGRVMHGARAWLGIGGLGIQPSEFAKLACILVLARYLEGVGEAVKRIPILVTGAGIVLLPIALTLAQPDFGTAMVFLPLYVVMAFAAGARLRHLAYMVLFLAVTGVFTMVPIWERNIYEGSISAVSVLTDPGALGLATAGLGTVTAIALIGFVATKRTYFYWLVYGTSILLLALPVAFAARATLAEYQLARLVVFLDPYTDPRGAGWNIIQSVTAVGSGGFTGRGFLEGTHSHYQYIPEQSTDFIFSILAEEWGFLGGIVVFALFLVILLRGLYIARTARDDFGALAAIGVVALLFFHFAVNVGMVIGIMPITGIPLFFLSHGGSSLLTAMAAVGVLVNVHHNRYHY